MHRYELIRNPEWKTYAESGQVPAEGEQVFVRYSVDRKWYRGHVDEVKQVAVDVLLDHVNWPRVGSGAVRIGPLRFLTGGGKSRTKSGFRLFC